MHSFKPNLNALNHQRMVKKIKKNFNSRTFVSVQQHWRIKIIIQRNKVVNFSALVNRPALMGILNGSILAGLGHLTGYMVFTSYAIVIFKEAGTTNINPHISAISLAVLQLIGNLCSATLSDSLGRRALLISSLLGSAFGMFTFALYCYIRSIGYDVVAFEWVPVISLSFVIFSA